MYCFHSSSSHIVAYKYTLIVRDVCGFCVFGHVTTTLGQVPTVTTSPSAGELLPCTLTKLVGESILFCYFYLDLTSTITIDHNGSTSNTIDGITTIIICATAAFIALVLLLLGSLWSLMIFVYMKKRKRLQTTSGFELRPTAEPASGISNPLFTSGKCSNMCTL